MTASGGMLYVQQLKAAGVEFIFFNPSTGDAEIYNALVDVPEIQLIKGIHEGAVVAMADGYARLSGKVGVAQIANIGLPTGMAQLVNSWKDRIPILLTVAGFGTDIAGGDRPQDYDHQETMLSPITKWFWNVESPATMAAATRRALKFAATPPAGPVFLTIPDDHLNATATADIYDAKLFNVAMKVRPDQKDVDAIARYLLEAKNPLISAGDEVVSGRAEPELLALAELLGIPVTVGSTAVLGSWSKPFPTRNPLFVGPYQRGGRMLGAVDVHFVIGSQLAERSIHGATSISMRSDYDSLARVGPIDLPIVSDIKLGLADVIASVKSQATAERIRAIADGRAARVHAYTADMARVRQTIAADLNNASSITAERLGIELEAGLERDAVYVCDLDSGRIMDPFMAFGGTDKTYVSTGPEVLGWAQAAAVGAALARPDRPIVSAMGDGSALFGGPQPLWSQARYSAPITNIVVNNKSYNNERNRVWTNVAGRQFATGKDMTCYNGSPNVDFAKAAAGYGVEGEVVTDPARIQEALGRSKRANIEGRPYLLDVHVDREGVGAASEWHPSYSIAAKRPRKA